MLLILFLWSCSQYTAVVPFSLLPPPLSVICSDPHHRVYQRHDNQRRVSCLWDGDIHLQYSKVPGPAPDVQKEGRDQQPPPHCRWYRDSTLVSHTNNWSGQLRVGTGSVSRGPRPPWAFTQITVQCVSSLCEWPPCLHYNLSVEMAGQDVRLFLLRPHELPVREWQPVQLGWCARLKRSTWIYHFRSQGGSPADLLVPSNQYREPGAPSVYPHAELHHVCESYYSYHVTVRYPVRGFYTVSLHLEHGPELSRSLELHVQPALLHVFTASSTLLSSPHRTLNLSWALRPLSSSITAFTLVDEQGLGDWDHSCSYNPFALPSNFCAVPKPQHSRQKVVSSIYFHTNKMVSGEVRGKLDFGGDTLIFTASRATPTHLTLKPQKIRTGTYIFSHKMGLFYSTQEDSTVNAIGENSSFHHVFYQQESFSYLITLEFLQLRWYRFSIHMYLNWRGTLFRSLGEKSLDIHVFSGYSLNKNLVYIVWFIPLQHPLLQCEWAFHLQLLDSKNNHTLWNNTYSYRDRVRNAAQFLPHALLPFRTALYAGFVAEVNCRSTGLARAVLKATVGVHASKVLEPQVPCEKSYCREVTATIQKPDPSNPVLSYTRQSTITLKATAKALCRTYSDIDVIWEMSSVQSTDPSGATSKVKTVGVTFHMPGKLLKAGLYHLGMTMTVYLPAYNLSISASDSVTIHIVESDLVAIIAGGSFRTVGVSDQWSLDGSASSDPDAANPHEGLLFNWFCSKRKSDFVELKLSFDGKCHLEQETLKWMGSQGPVQIVQQDKLLPNNTYYFVLRIAKGRKTADAYQTVQVLPGSLPVLNFTCIQNCRKNINPANRLILYGKCLNCKAHPAIYHWSLYSSSSNEILFDWDSKTSTGRSKPYLSINPLAFTSMPHKSYTLSLRTSTQGIQEATYMYSFSINAPPRTGKCIIYPRVGSAFLTKFTVQCNGFEDENGPLTYKIIAHSDEMKMTKKSFIQNSSFGTMVYVGHQHKILPSFLPLGIPSENYTLTICVQVYDALGAFSEEVLQATVYDPRKNKPTYDVLNELHSFISGPMAVFFEMKDYFNIGYYVYMAASVLNNLEASPAIHGSKIDLRAALLSVSAGIPMAEVEVIKQVISSICQITQNVSEVNGKSQLLSVRILKEAGGALRRYKAKDVSSKETETLVNGIFTGLSNVLTAALLNSRHVNVNSVKETIAATEILADLVLQDKVPGEYETNLEAKYWAMHLRKDEKESVSQTFRERNCENCFYPKMKENDSDLPADAVVSTVLYEFAENPFPWLVDTAASHTIVTGFRMTAARENGDLMGLTPEVAEVIMNINDDSATFDLTVGPDKAHQKTIGGFRFEVNRISKDVFIQIMSILAVTFNVSLYLGLNVSCPPILSYVASFDKPPILNGKDSNISDCAIKAPCILCLPQSLLRSLAEGSTADKWNISVVLQSPPIVRGRTTKIIRVAVFTTECLDLNGIQNQWGNATCSPGSQSNWSKIHCICNLEKSVIKTRSPRSAKPPNPGVRFFAGTFQIYPNPLDIKKVLLAEFDTNPVTLLTVFFIFAIYIFLLIWATIQDKVDMKRKNKILVVADNDPFHRVFYLVTVYTGSRLGSGTTAAVFIELRGQNTVSDVHRLEHPAFPTFFRASVDTFLLTTKKDLGDISSIHVWHNNGGSSPNWYLSRVKVQNVKTKQSWLFLCRNWFSLDKANCHIERSFLVTNQHVPLKKMDYFLIKLAKDLEESHVWLSVFARVVTGPFNRVQRLSCCLAIMLSNLMFNIMFFSGEQETQVFSLQVRYMKSMYIGFVSALFSIPVHLTIITLFRYSQEKPLVYQGDEYERRIHSIFVPANTRDAQHPSSTSSSSSSSSQLDTNYSNNILAEKDRDTKTIRRLIRPVLRFFKRPQFPWWGIYVSWTLVFLISTIASFLIILYGLTYGYTTSLEWFIASMTSFFESVFLLQTFKIVLISAASTVLIKYCKHISWINAEKYTEMKLEKVIVEPKDTRKLHDELVQIRGTREYQPLEEDELIILRKRTRAQHLAFIFVRDIIAHFVFSFCVFSIIHSAHTTTSFYYKQDLYNEFSVNLSRVNRLEDVYTWASNVFVPQIHNDYQPTYLSETWSKILGLPRMRQVRATGTGKACFHPYSFVTSFLMNYDHCRHEYGVDLADDIDYMESWAIPIQQPTSRHPSSFEGFTYEPGDDQWTYESYGVLNNYGPEGYSFYFFPREQRPNSTMRLDELQRNHWLDGRTWAVIFELTTFNADIDQYCSITIVFETSDIGVVNASLLVHAYKLSLFHLQTRYQIAAYGVMICILVFYLADEFQILHKEKIGYLKKTTNLINFGMKTMCIYFIFLIAYKFKLAYHLLQFFLLNPEQFVPFHVVSQADQLFRTVSGVLTFLLVLKPYRYFRFMYHMRLAENTMAAAFPQFVSLSILTGLMLFAYISSGYLLFGVYDWHYHSFIHATQTVVSYCIHTALLLNIETASPSSLRILFQISFMFIVICVFINFWRVVTIFTYTSMKQPTYEQHSDEAEAVNFMVHKIQSLWFCITHPTPPTSNSTRVESILFGKPKQRDHQHPRLKSK